MFLYQPPIMRLIDIAYLYWIQEHTTTMQRCLTNIPFYYNLWLEVGTLTKYGHTGAVTLIIVLS